MPCPTADRLFEEGEVVSCPLPDRETPQGPQSGVWGDGHEPDQIHGLSPIAYHETETFDPVRSSAFHVSTVIWAGVSEW